MAFVNCWDNAVSQDQLPALEAEARVLWQKLGGSRDYAKTSWVDVSAKPRCALERLAFDILRFHFPKASDRREVAGLEFWTQLRRSQDESEKQGLTLHYDKDEQAVEKFDMWSHPCLGTATYLSGGGAPFLAFSTQSQDDFDTSSEEEGQENSDGENSGGENAAGDEERRTPDSAWLCYPRVCRHVVFLGNMLHGIPEELLEFDGTGSRKKAKKNSEDTSWERLSFLVNIWTRRPEGLRPLSASIVDKLTAAARAAEGGRRKSAWALKADHEELTPTTVDVEVPQGKRVRPGRFVPGTRLYALRDHRRTDTGLIPVEAIAGSLKPSTTDSEHVRRGLFHVRYQEGPQPVLKRRSTGAAVIKRPSAAPALKRHSTGAAVIKRPSAATPSGRPSKSPAVLKKPASAQASQATAMLKRPAAKVKTVRPAAKVKTVRSKSSPADENAVLSKTIGSESQNSL